MHYYQFNIADYRKDTGHLSLVEHAIYRQLLDFYYLDERPIPSDPAWFIRRFGIHAEQVETILREFFDPQDDGWHHARCDAEIAKYQHFVEDGKKGAAKRWGPKVDSIQSLTYSPPIAPPMPPHKPPQSGANATPMLTTNQEPITTNQEESKTFAPTQNIGAEDKKFLFDYGSEVLRVAGVSEKSIGSLIGKMLKTVDVEEATSILGAIQSKKDGTMNAVGYITSALRGKGTPAYKELRKRYKNIKVLADGRFNCNGSIYNADGSGGLCI